MKRQSLIFRLLTGIMLLCTSTLSADDAHDENDCPLVIPEFDDTALLTREERIQMMDQALEDALSQVQDCRQMLMERSDGASGSGSASGGAAGNAGAQDGDADRANSEQSATDRAGSEKGDAESSETASPDSELSGTEPSEQASDATEADNKGSSPSPQTATPSSELSGTDPSEQASDATETDNRGSPPGLQTATPSGELSGTELPKQKIDPKIKRPKQPRGQASHPSTEIDDRTGLGGGGKLPEDIPPANNDDIVARQIRNAAIAESDPKKQAKLWNEYRRYKGLPEK